MSYITKLESAQAELSKSNIWKLNANPYAFLLLRKIGLNVRPFHYNTFFMNILTSSIFFACVWGVLMWFTTWSSQGMQLSNIFLSSILAGLVFGLLMAIYYKCSASSNALSSWSDL